MSGLLPQERELIEHIQYLEEEAEDSNRRAQIITQKMRGAGMSEEEIELFIAQKNAAFVSSTLSLAPWAKK